jgi:hypothetical protein
MTVLVILTAIRAVRAESDAPAPKAKIVPRAERRRIERRQAAKR